MYPALSTYNIEFVALAVGMMNLVELTGNSCCVSGHPWALCIVVSAQLIEMTLFMGELLM